MSAAWARVSMVAGHAGCVACAQDEAAALTNYRLARSLLMTKAGITVGQKPAAIGRSGMGKVMVKHRSQKKLPSKFNMILRRGRDSNPRYGYPYAAFRVRCFQPLSHLSVAAEGANILSVGGYVSNARRLNKSVAPHASR